MNNDTVKFTIINDENKRNEETVEFAEILLQKAKDGVFDALLVVSIRKDGTWAFNNTTIIGVSEKIGLLNRVIYELLRQVDG